MITVLRQRHAGDGVTREKLKILLEEYGRLAIWVYLVLWLAVLAGFAVAISTGFKADSGAAGLGVLGAAWVATKLTQPLRIGATLLLSVACGGTHRPVCRRRRAAADGAQALQRVEASRHSGDVR